MKINEDGTKIKIVACDYSKGRNGVVSRMGHLFTIGALNFHK